MPAASDARGSTAPRSYRREKLVLALIAVAVCSSLYPLNTQDVTRLSLSVSVVHRQTLDVDPFHRLMLDRAFRDGHWYSDKPPGMSFLAIPGVELFRAVDRARGGAQIPVWTRQGQLWALRVATSGIPLLVLALLVGRVAEGLAEGTGAATAVTFALGTIAGPLAPTLLQHDAAAALAFGGFLLAWRRPGAAALAGLVAGTAILFEYQAALACLLTGAYVGMRRGPRRAALYALGVVPPVAALGVYNAAAFGSPLHFSYAYVSNSFTRLQEQGFFGIGAPRAHGAWLALFDGRGLLTVSPVLAAAAAGLALLFRSGLRAEALAAAAVVAGFLVVDVGYFDPYGGTAPGPRFLVVALPFLALGLPPAFARAAVATAGLALASIVLVTWDTFTWKGVSGFTPDLPPQTIWSRLGLPVPAGIAIVACATAAAAALAAVELFGPGRRARLGRGAEVAASGELAS